MAGNYNANIPSLLGLNDANAAALTQPAPGVVAGTGRSLQDVTNAREETEARKKLKRADNASVTDNEISEAVVRETAVAVEVSSGLYGAGGAPAWAAPLMGLPAQVNALVGQVNALMGLPAQVTALTAAIACMQAQSTNRACSGNGQNLENFLLSQPQKKTAGIGPPLPAHPGGAPMAATLAGAVPAAVGTLFPAGVQAPTNSHDIGTMTHGQISALAEWSNETFGIVAGDNLFLRRRKIGIFYGV